MITPKTPPQGADIARHYDELDDLYREIWGDHLHHGFWETDQDERTVEEATLHLLQELISPLSLNPGSKVLDIGCGYGASARFLAEQHGAHFTALTVSERQVVQARRAALPKSGKVDYLLEDWLENSLPESSFDAAIAIESLAHMTDKRRFFEQLHRTLNPGGRAALAVWTTADHPNWIEQRLLEKICAEGRLPGIGTLHEYTTLAENFGFIITSAEDVTSHVERTWWIIARRVLFGAFTRPRYFRFILRRLFREPIFVLTLPRLLLAYRTGALRYAFLTLSKTPS